jgi:hypothetical protein
MATPWREHSKLRGRFHPQYPDDLEVLVHDGGPRIAATAPELMWVRVVGMSDDAFLGTLLNAPKQLTSVAIGAEILFVVPKRFEYPLRVTAQYLAERTKWDVHACSGCGLDELFDAPSSLIAKVFPNTPGELEMFSALCGARGGAQVVKKIAAQPRTESADARPWWKRWFAR